MPVAREQLLETVIVGRIELMMVHRRGTGMESAGEMLRMLDLTTENTALFIAGWKVRNPLVQEPLV